MIKYLMIFLGIAVGGFVGWMNVTPGHFRTWCSRCDGVRYLYIDPNAFYAPCPVNNMEYACVIPIRDRLLLLLANFDLYK